jgi:hypothetical protein
MGIFLAVSSIKHLVNLFLAYTGKKKSEIAVSFSFSGRPTFRQMILKIASASQENLLQKLF